MMKKPQDNHAAIRADKWLWAARFFKTRSLAMAAINGGKVHLNGSRIKPAHKLGIG
ncbi:MAG: RNA-binding S4 domain-containing protein, partial [Gammaproteobacteria bacterium]|nr:RNA-binding S4 domain-containing protein [Gammaproteobacteria bacterium]